MQKISIVPELEMTHKRSTVHKGFTEVLIDYSAQVRKHLENGGTINNLKLESVWLSKKDMKGDYFYMGAKI